MEAREWAEVERFAFELYGGPEGAATRLKLVLKPCRSAGTDNVFFVASLTEARRAFDVILGDANIFGERNEVVLVQEFLQVRRLGPGGSVMDLIVPSGFTNPPLGHAVRLVTGN